MGKLAAAILVGLTILETAMVAVLGMTWVALVVVMVVSTAALSAGLYFGCRIADQSTPAAQEVVLDRGPDDRLTILWPDQDHLAPVRLTPEQFGQIIRRINVLEGNEDPTA